MKEKIIQSTLTVYENLEELPTSVRELFHHAEKARDKAYAPYSEFLVGAALQLDSGAIVTGNNQENAAYPSGLCAERTAIFYAGANYPGEKIDAMAISIKSLRKTVDTPAPPCGACRQAIAEYEYKQNQAIPIYFRGETGEIIKVNSLLDILPLAFNNSFM